MGKLSGHKQVFHGAVDVIDASQLEKLGVRAIDETGNEFIYLKGVASVGVGSWVTLNENYETALLVAGAVGPVAIAAAAIDSTSEFGWFQIFGVNKDAKTDTIATDSALYIDGTAGRVDDLGVSGDLVIGAYSMTADSSNVATVFIIYPSVSSDLGAAAGTLTAETPTGTVNDTNTSFTVVNTPKFIAVNGAIYRAGEGIFTSFSGGTITLSSAVGTGGFITSWYEA